MRIRTIKPAFWTNEKMAALPDFARLLAIGLLNYADDHGFFWANSLMIRGALFPFEEDSSKVRKGLAQLATEGYIRLGKSTDGREVGHVVNFDKHQRVDKPQKSEIQPLATFQDQSENDLGGAEDQSALEGKGKEGKGKEEEGAAPRASVPSASQKKPEPERTVIPLLLSTEEFAAAWADWLQHRREKKEPVKPGSQTEKQQLKTLEAWGVQRAVAAIRHTIFKGWTGLREPDERDAQQRPIGQNPANGYHATASIPSNLR